MSEKEDIAALISNAGIQAGDFVWLFADVTKMALHYRRAGERFDPNLLIDAVLEAIGPEGTLILPTLNFDLRTGESWNREKTAGVCGALSEIARRRRDFERTKNALHSFVVKGKLRDKLFECDHLCSYGKGSVFELMHTENCTLLSIDLSLHNSFTFIHYIEEIERVPYRYDRVVKVNVGDKVEQFRIFSKKAGYSLDLHPLEMVLREKRLIKDLSEQPFSVWTMDLANSIPAVQEELRKNKAKNILRFDVVAKLKETLRSFGWRSKNDKIREAARTR